MEILSLGEKIKRKRKEYNLTLKELAGDRITPGQISLVESGKSNPSMDLLEYLATTLNTSMEYLMESEEAQAESICKYFENIAECYILNDDLNQAEQYIEKSLYYAEKYSLQYRKAKNLYFRAIVYMTREEVGLAQQFFLSANVIFIKSSSFEDVVNTFLKLGEISLKLKAYRSASSYFQQAENVFSDNDIGNDFLLGKIYNFIAFTYFKLDILDKAINYSYLAKEKFVQLNNKEEYAKVLLLLSKEYSEQGDVNNAIKYSKKTLSLFKEISDNFYVAEIENNLGKLFYEFENIEESFIHLYNAKEIRERIKDIKLIETLVNICENHIKMKDIKSCKKSLEDLLNYVQSLSDGSLIEYYLLKYRIDMLEGNDLEAENTLHMALAFTKNMGCIKQTADIAIMVGKYYMDKGDDKEAAKYLNEGIEVLKKLKIIKER
jgi:transcriptional regulator with XRE-family HTH domain